MCAMVKGTEFKIKQMQHRSYQQSIDLKAQEDLAVSIEYIVVYAVCYI